MPYLDLIRPDAPADREYEETNEPADAAHAGWPREMRTAFAPVRFEPPAGCLGPVVCARIGSCDRHAGGRPCEVVA